MILKSKKDGYIQEEEDGRGAKYTTALQASFFPWIKHYWGQGWASPAVRELSPGRIICPTPELRRVIQSPSIPFPFVRLHSPYSVSLSLSSPNLFTGTTHLQTFYGSSNQQPSIALSTSHNIYSIQQLLIYMYTSLLLYNNRHLYTLFSVYFLNFPLLLLRIANKRTQLFGIISSSNLLQVAAVLQPMV